MSAVKEASREEMPSDALEIATLRAHIIEQLERGGDDAITFTCPHCNVAEFELSPEGQTRIDIIDALIADGVHFSKKTDSDPQCTAPNVPFYRAIYLDEQGNVRTKTFKLDEAEQHMLEIIRAARKAGEQAGEAHSRAESMPQVQMIKKSHQKLIDIFRAYIADGLNIDTNAVEGIPDAEVLSVLQHGCEIRTEEWVDMPVLYAIAEALDLDSDELARIYVGAANEEAGRQAVVERIKRVAKQRHGQLRLALEALGAPRTPERGIDIKAGLEMVNARVRTMRK